MPEYQPFIDAMKLALKENNRELIKQMNSSMQDLRAEMKSDMQEFREEIYQRIDLLENNMNERFKEVYISLDEIKNNQSYLEAKFIEHDKEIYQLQRRTGL